MAADGAPVSSACSGENGAAARSRGEMPERRRRIVALDVLRGFTIVSMVLFHGMFDLAYVFGLDAPWFTSGPIQGIWRCSISWVFIALAGWMTAFARSNWRRSLAYAAAALVVSGATVLVPVSMPISFGILFCMACCTALYAAAGRFVDRLPAIPSVAVMVLLFACTYKVPTFTYPVEHLAWLGFPSPQFYSGDYYPIVPYVFLYFAAARLAHLPWRYPEWMYCRLCPPLAFLGRHSLLIYLAHQPIVLLAIGGALFLIGGA